MAMIPHCCRRVSLRVLAAIAVLALLSQVRAQGDLFNEGIKRPAKFSTRPDLQTTSCPPTVARLLSGSSPPHHDPEHQARAVTDAVMRLLPTQGHLFHVSVDPTLAPDGLDTVQVVSSVENDTVEVSVTGSGGVAAAWGILHYLKQYCHCHISWEADQLSLPQTLPKVNVTITAMDRVRYYQNVCTVSYSSVWWQWPRWEREIDWMALNGINLALAFTGQEALWRRVYLNLGLTDGELQTYFTGPAFLAWHRMGNLMAWGGPLPVSWHNATELLQKKILIRMRELGITPVLPCFAGHVPEAIKRLFPNANVTRQAQWRQFNDTYTRTFMLEPTDPLYHKIGTMFMEEMRRAYNYTDGVYNCDPFNEMEPRSNSSQYISSVAKAIYGSMRSSDPSAVWLMQAWMFVSGRNFWTQDLARALFTSVPQGHILVLDVSAANIPVWNHYNSFYGQPFVFCMMLNNGGVDGLSGYTQRLLETLKEARSSNNTMIGSGLTMEGINQNYVMYDLMMEMAWEVPPTDMLDWAADYSLRRYGTDTLQDVGRTLMLHVYNNTKLSYHGQHTIARRPTLDASLVVWYPLPELVTAWDGLVKHINASASQLMQTNFPTSVTSGEQGWAGYSQTPSRQAESVTGQATFRHDVVDVTREVLQDLGALAACQMVQEYKNNSFEGVTSMGRYLVSLLEDLDELLASSPAFLLGRWTSDAAVWATSEEERRLYIYNSLNQITLWGPPPPQGDLDYAVKQWAGVVGRYFLPRWEVFISALLESLEKGTPFNNDTLNNELLRTVEEPFTFDTGRAYPSEPVGDPLAVALRLYVKYRPEFERSQGRLLRPGMEL